MATRDCIEARLPGLRNYPQRSHCDPYFALHFSALAVRESDPTAQSGVELPGRFSDARDFLQCALTSLTARDDRCFYSPEVTCLQHGLALLREVYNDVDLRLLHERRATADSDPS